MASSDNIIQFFFRKLVLREREIEIFFQTLRHVNLFEYKKNTNKMLTFFTVFTREEILFDERSKRDGLRETCEDCQSKRGDLYEKIRYALETNHLIRKKDRDNLIRLLEESEEVYRRALSKWRQIKTPQELIGDSGDKFAENVNQKEFEEKVRCLNEYINKMIRKSYIILNTTMLSALLLIVLLSLFFFILRPNSSSIFVG